MLLTRVLIVSGCIFFAGCISVPVESERASDTGIPHQSIVNAYHNIHYSNPGYFPAGYHCNGGYYSARGYRD